MKGALRAIRSRMGGQGGFSMAEVLAFLAVMTIVGPALVGSLFQMQKIASRSSAQLAVEADFRTAMQWLGRDFRVAKTVSLVDGAPAVDCAPLAPNPCITLEWTDRYAEAGVSHLVSYALIGAELRRTYDGTVLTVGRHVLSATASRQGDLVTFTLRSAGGEWGDLDTQVSHYFYIRSA